VVEEKGADYLLMFKDNQKTRHRLLETMDWGLFPPVHRACEGSVADYGPSR